MIVTCLYNNYKDMKLSYCELCATTTQVVYVSLLYMYNISLVGLLDDNSSIFVLQHY